MAELYDDLAAGKPVVDVLTKRGEDFSKAAAKYATYYARVCILPTTTTTTPG